MTVDLGAFVTKDQGHALRGKGRNGLSFVNKIVSRLKVADLVDTSATHSFVSE